MFACPIILRLHLLYFRYVSALQHPWILYLVCAKIFNTTSRRRRPFFVACNILRGNYTSFTRLTGTIFKSRSSCCNLFDSLIELKLSIPRGNYRINICPRSLLINYSFYHIIGIIGDQWVTHGKLCIFHRNKIESLFRATCSVCVTLTYWRSGQTGNESNDDGNNVLGKTNYAVAWERKLKVMQFIFEVPIKLCFENLIDRSNMQFRFYWIVVAWVLGHDSM